MSLQLLSNTHYLSRCESLVIKLLGAHYASVYGAAAEVVGLILKYNSSQEDGKGYLKV